MSEQDGANPAPLCLLLPLFFSYGSDCLIIRFSSCVACRSFFIRTSIKVIELAELLSGGLFQVRLLIVALVRSFLSSSSCDPS